MRRRLISLVVAAGISGCASGSTTTPSPSNPPPPTVVSSSTTSAAATVPRPRRRSAAAHRAPRTANTAGLPASSASADVIQSQPPAGTCHASGQPPYSLPDPHCTPGAVNPAVTQATLDQTICVSGYTKTIRPAESVTEPEKQASMAAYGDTGLMSGYEYDHLVSLALGGAVNDARNLWPEPGATPNPKDAVENDLHRLVCSGRMPLTAAQHIIATNWVAYARSHDTASSAPAPEAGGGQSRSVAHCSASATYSPRYRDWDVYVHSDQPGATLTVSDASGRSKKWRTDGAGNSDVYFKAPAGATGETIIVRVGGASCRTSL